MKKALVLLVAIVLTLGAQAQIGGLVGGAIRKSVEKKIEKTVENKADELLGNKKQQNDKPTVNEYTKAESTTNEKKIPTPEEIMGMVPTLPSHQNLADYACEQNRANPRTLKLLANPTTTFLTKMTMALASGYVVMMGAGQSGSVYYYDEQLLSELGITQEQFDAMSEEEQQQLAQKYAAEIQERYIRTTERLAADETYKKLQEQYYDIDRDIEKLFAAADSTNRMLWKNKYASAGTVSEADMCGYFKEAVPTSYKAVNDAMNLRRTKQLPIAKQMDEQVQLLAKKYPNEVFAGFINQGGLCATAYVSDASRLTAFSDPR